LDVSTLESDQLKIIEVDPRGAPARDCLEQYYAELRRRFPGGFEVSRSRDPDAGDKIAPRGAFLIALSDGAPVGCVGLKGGEAFAEIKRLWVSPSARGMGLARRLMSAAEARARALGISVLRLDTNSALPEASALYLKTGWREIPRFNDDPYPDLFFEKRL
jgi:GNAT superfamily N-acetyltransferase